MTKQAFLVYGPESSGTRFVTSLLMAAGCHGTDDHTQRYDHETPQNETPIVWRRSVPHSGHWPNVGEMALQLRNVGYSVTGIACVRDWHSNVASQIRMGHAPDVGTAVQNIQRAYQHIFGGLFIAGVPFVIASYDHLTTRPEAAATFCAGLGLELAQPFEIYDGNAKYYEALVEKETA